MSSLKKYSWVLFCACILATSSGFAQKASVAQKADQAFDQKQYRQALEQYEKAYLKVKSNRFEKNRIQFQIGECYRYMEDFQKAVNIYKKLIRAKYYIVEPKIYDHIAEAYRFSNQLDLARENYDQYLKLKPEDTYVESRRKSLMEFSLILANKTRHVIKPMEFINSDYNEWFPRFLGADTTALIFTGSLTGTADEKVDPWTGQGYSNIYMIRHDKRGKWMDVEIFDKDLMIPEYNEGEATFSPDGNTIYFSRCANEKGKTMGCHIYTAFRASDKGKKRKNEEQTTGAWSKPERLILGDTNHNYLHPEISSDGLTLYFSSDMLDGEGDFDLWVITRNNMDAPFGKALNLGSSINTPGREVYPSLKNDSTLAFSSSGLPGLGGLDLFVTSSQNGFWTTPINLGYPLNTTYDEIGIAYYPQDPSSNIEERGYISSNRPIPDPHSKDAMKNLKRKKQKTLNDDIWYFELPALLYSIEGTIRDDKSMQLIPETKVRLISSDGITSEIYTDKKGFFKFGSELIKRNQQYKLYVSKVDYFSVEASESTMGYTTNKDIIRSFKLQPIPSQPVVLPEIRYDLSKWELKDEYKDSLLDLYTILVNNPNVVIEIRSHTDCRPYLGLTNDTLSQRRAESVVRFLIDRGIEPERLIAKGYGDRVPLQLENEKEVHINGQTYAFKKGQTLDCEYIKYIKSKDEQNAAHELNRRTEFFVLRTDFVSKKLVDNFTEERPKTEEEKIIDLVTPPKQEVIQTPKIVYDESTVPVTMIQSTKGELTAIVNGAQGILLIDEHYKDQIAFSWEEAMTFIYQKRITKDDFPERDNAFDPEGNILDKSILILKKIKIGNYEIENVEVAVLKGISHKLIMNRNGLKLFGPYEFDKEKGRIQFLNKPGK